MKNVVFQRKKQLNEKCEVKRKVKRNDVMAPKMIREHSEWQALSSCR